MQKFTDVLVKAKENTFIFVGPKNCTHRARAYFLNISRVGHHSQDDTPALSESQLYSLKQTEADSLSPVVNTAPTSITTGLFSHPIAVNKPLSEYQNQSAHDSTPNEVEEASDSSIRSEKSEEQSQAIETHLVSHTVTDSSDLMSDINVERRKEIYLTRGRNESADIAASAVIPECTARRMVYNRCVDDALKHPRKTCEINAHGITYHSEHSGHDSAHNASSDASSCNILQTPIYDNTGLKKSRIKIKRRPLPTAEMMPLEQNSGTNAAQVPEIEATVSPPSYTECFVNNGASGHSVVRRPRERLPYDSEESNDEIDDQPPPQSVPIKSGSGLFGKPVAVGNKQKMKESGLIHKREMWHLDSSDDDQVDVKAAELDSLLNVNADPETVAAKLDKMTGTSTVPVAPVEQIVAAESDEDEADDDKQESESLPESPQPGDGEMIHITDKKFDLPGNFGQGTIMITFRFGSGVEKSNPRKSYNALDMSIFLPANLQGQQVFQLMERAFDKRLLFRVEYNGKSSEIGCLISNGINMKTEKFDYFDRDYLPTVTRQLKDLLHEDDDL
jgi:hypothetical protein